MKILLLSLLCCFVLCEACSADGLFVSDELNKLLPKIHAGMAAQEVGAVLARAYPSIRSGGCFGFSDGQFSRYNLDARFTLGFYFVLHHGRYVVADPVTFSIFDAANKRHWDVKAVDGGGSAR